MPISSYYGGEGRTVMKNMKDEYGSGDGERVFYATASKQRKKGKGKHPKKSRRRSTKQ